MPHVQQLVCDKCWYGDSPLCILVCALPHQLFMHSSVFCSLLLKGKQYLSPWSNDQWCKTCVGSEVYTEDNSPCTTLQLLHDCFAENYVHINTFSESIVVHFKQRYTKQLWHWKNSTWLYIQFIQNKYLMYMINSLSLSIWQLYVLLLNGEDGSDKRQVAIHIILNLNFLQKCP